MLFVAKEEEIRQRRVEEIRVFSAHFHQIQSLAPRVPPAPERLRLLHWPWHFALLHRKDVERDAVHRLECRLGQVVRGHHNVERVVAAAPREHRIRAVGARHAALLHQRPIAQIHEELHIRQPHPPRQRRQNRVGEHLEAGVLAVALAVHCVRLDDVVAQRDAPGMVEFLEHLGPNRGKADVLEWPQVVFDLLEGFRAFVPEKPGVDVRLWATALLRVHWTSDGVGRIGNVPSIVAYVNVDVLAGAKHFVADDVRAVSAIQLLDPEQTGTSRHSIDDFHVELHRKR